MVARVIEDETILLPIYKTSDDINCIYTLNESASYVWELIDGKRTQTDIKKEVLQKFDVAPEEADKELSELFKDMRKIKAVK